MATHYEDGQELSGAGADVPNCLYMWPRPRGMSEVPLDKYQPPHMGMDLRDIELRGEDDVAIFVDYSPDAVLHAACGVKGSPVAPHADGPAASARALMAWFYTLVTGIAPRSRTLTGSGQPNLRVFQRLGYTEFAAVVTAVTNATRRWGALLEDDRLSIGELFMATPSSGGAAGGGRGPQVSVLGVGPFVLRN